MGLPDITHYIDYKAYLKAWFDAKKRADSDYSLARFAEDGDCARSCLCQAMNGKRTPRTDTLDKFATAMRLTPMERNYLGALVDLSKASGLSARRRAMERLISLHPKGDLQPGPASKGLLDHWYLSAICELARLPGFRDDPGWIAAMICPPITEAEAEVGLASLLELGFLRKGPDGVWAEGVRTATGAESNDHAVARYHREVIPERLRVIDTSLAKEQLLTVATFVVPQVLVEEFKIDIHNLVKQLATKADTLNATEHAEPIRVYQLSVQLLPVSEPVS